LKIINFKLGSNEIANSDSEQSDGENKLSISTRNKSKQDRHSPDSNFSTIILVVVSYLFRS